MCGKPEMEQFLTPLKMLFSMLNTNSYEISLNKYNYSHNISVF